MGGAYLFEKPRSGARNIPRFSDITSDDGDCTYDANYDSGTWNATKNQWQLGNNDDSAYCPTKPDTNRAHLGEDYHVL